MRNDPFAVRKISITKLEAARRQLATAIELWFLDGDPVSIHTLAYAAHEIIHVIFRRRGGKGLLFDNEVIKPEYRSEFNKFIKEDANFIKHAKDDYDSTREFNTTAGLMFIVMGVMGIVKMGESPSDPESIFLTWARFNRPNWFTDNIADYGIPADVIRYLSYVNKSEFYKFLAQARREFLARATS